MQLHKLYQAFIAATISLASLASAQTPPIRIMPLGDSITNGSSFDSPDGSGGYRGPLYTSLTNAGYNVDYIGTLTVNSSLIPDQDHEGHGGWRIDQLDTPMAGWLSTMADPDVVLMHIGTNDFGQNFSTSTAIDRLDALILKIATLRPYCHIIVTNLMERGETANTNIQTLFNPFVQALVNAHAAAGRRVTFLDMRAAVPLSDMPDSLHPDQNGYDKMAAAWLPAIQAVISPLGDAQPPGIYRAVGNADLTEVTITFSKPVADTAAALGNFSISGGLTVSAASLDATKRIVTLTTSQQTRNTNYTVTINGVVDRTVAANALPANSAISFIGAPQRGYANNVPESDCYALVQSLDVPSTANFGLNAVPYSVDNRAAIGPFSRIAYYIELQGDGPLQFLWASMDAFTGDVNKIGVPTLGSGAMFQQAVTNMNVISNVAGLTTGTGLTGNLEFWPTNYNATNPTAVPGASETNYDFGDAPTPGSYGSMQLHHTSSGQTLFAYNNWGTASTTAATADIGIGNSPGANSDWTFTNNGAAYTIKSIQFLVQTDGDVAGPTISSAQASFGLTKVVVKFSEPINAASVNAFHFSLSNGVQILAATPSANMREVVLSTSPLPAGTPLTLTVSGVRDTSPRANLIAPHSTIVVAAAALPPEIVTNIGAAAADYELVATLDIPTVGNLNAQGAAAYRFDERNAPGTFTRVAYYMELEKPNGTVQYVWTSMDAFAAGRSAIVVPTVSTGAVFQKNVTNMEVVSNVAGVVNGTTATGGNIEFWPNSYSVANAVTVPNASATNYDTGDTRTTTSTTGYGCMQVHNHDAGANQTVFALNRFGIDGQILDVGIGNNPAPVSNGVDWTFASNAPSFTRRLLHVLVLPGQTTAPEVVAKAPEAANYQLVYSLNIPTTGNLVSGAGFTNYAVNSSAEIGKFSRVAYYMELQKTGDAAPRYVWVSMPPLSTLPSRIGVPTPASGAVFQQNVENMNVASNVPGITTGTGITTGNIEFWPTNYTQANALAVPGASATTYDFGDTRSTTGSHGSMQIHNHGATQTLFALNNWGTAANTANVLSMGIGNNPTAGQAPDYTVTANAASWDLRRVLQVYVLPSTDDLGPVITRAVGSTTLNRLVVSFDEPIAETSAIPGNFSIAGLTVNTATLLSNGREIALTTSPQTPATSYTISVSNVRDRAMGNLILPSASIDFTAYSPPALLSGIADAADYEMIYRLAIPSASPQWNLNTIPYSVDESKYGERLFDRVAYLLELDSTWVWVSFDRHTNSLTKIGIPTLSVSATALQQLVTNMNVASNSPNITTGTGITTGNIEFWGGNYSGANALTIPNASATTFDFGDTMTSGTYGSMQIHNHGASQVLMAYNNWGSNAGQTSETGIGNHPTPSVTASGAQLDWTFSNNATVSTVKNLYVFARAGGTATGSAPVFYAHPCDRTVETGTTTTFMASAAGATSWQWRKNGIPITGATNAWLEISNVSAADSSTYDVIAYGPTLVSTTSMPAALTVTPATNLVTPSSIVINSNGTVDLIFHGTPGQSYAVERSTNLINWDVLTTITAGANGQIPFLDPTPPPIRAFYRTRVP